MERARLVLADSHQIMLESLRDLVGSTFDIVATAEDEQSLLEAAKTCEPDVAVVDLSISVHGGVNIVRRLRNQHPKLKVIVLSVHDEKTVVTETLAAGAPGFVLKRSAVSDLIPAIREVIRGRTYVSPVLRD